MNCDSSCPRSALVSHISCSRWLGRRRGEPWFLSWAAVVQHRGGQPDLCGPQRVLGAEPVDRRAGGGTAAHGPWGGLVRTEECRRDATLTCIPVSELKVTYASPIRARQKDRVFPGNGGTG